MSHARPGRRGHTDAGREPEPSQSAGEDGGGTGAGHPYDGAQARPRPRPREGQVGDGDGGVAGEKPGRGGKLRLPGGARPSQQDQVVNQLGGVAGQAGDPGGGHDGGAVAPVPGDGVEADQRETGGHGFQGREPAGVLDQHVAGSHQPGHVVGPAEHDGPVALGLGHALQVQA